MPITGKFCSFCKRTVTVSGDEGTSAIASIIQDAHPQHVWRICREHLMQIVPATSSPCPVQPELPE